MQSDRRESAASQTLPLNCCLFHQDIFPTVTLVGRPPEVLIFGGRPKPANEGRLKTGQ